MDHTIEAIVGNEYRLTPTCSLVSRHNFLEPSLDIEYPTQIPGYVISSPP
jgi:hypothetical protein